MKNVFLRKISLLLAVFVLAVLCVVVPNFKAQAQVTYTATTHAFYPYGGTISPASQSVPSGTGATFVVTGTPGYTPNISADGFNGDCTYGSASSSVVNGTTTTTFTTGPVTSNCDLWISWTYNPVYCPSASVIVNNANPIYPSSVVVWVPSGFTGGSFSSASPSVVSLGAPTTVFGNPGSGINLVAVGTGYIHADGWSYSNGAMNCSLTPVAINVTAASFPPMSGTLTPSSSSCVIASGASTCNINYSWNTYNPVATSSVTKPTNITVATGNYGTNVPFAVGWGGNTFYLYNNGILLAQSTVAGANVTCAAGTVWNGTKCAVPVMSGTLTPATSSCVVASGASTCTINYSWNTLYPVATSSVTKPTNITVGSGNTGTNVPFTIKWGGDTFYLYNNAVLLAQSTVLSSNVTCAAGTGWNGTKCSVNAICQDSSALNAGGPVPCVYSQGGGTICQNGAVNPPMCTIKANGTCVNGATNPALCTINGSGVCLNGATNPALCTINGSGTCLNGANNPPTCSLNVGGTCLNNATNPPTCNQFKKKPAFIEN